MARLVIHDARVIIPGGILRGDVLVEDGVICRIGQGLTAEVILDAHGDYLAPGFVEIHSHGGGGFDFLDGTEEALTTISRFHACHGTTTLIPTYTSSDMEELLAALAAYERLRGTPLGGADLPGIHLEGPYFSPKQGGAQDPRYMRGFDPEEYGHILRCCPHILRWSVAPELPGAEAFARELRRRGILLAVAHSDATWEEMCAARKWGFSHITHLYSCMSTVTRRNAYRYAGVVESAFLLDDMTVEIIADGCHLPEPLLRFVMKFKGKEKTALISDSMSGAGMPDGPSVIGSQKHGQPVILEDGVAKLPDRSCFAGSVATSDRLVRTMVCLAGVSVEDAVYMASTVPARILGLSRVGSIEPGKDADLVLLGNELQVKRTILKGKVMQ